MSRKAIVSLVLVVCAVKSTFSENVALVKGPNRIAFGEDVYIEDYPYIAQVITSLGHCTATLISPKCVLAAAHCIVNKNGIKVDSGSVRVGMTYASEAQPHFEALGLYEHPLFNRTGNVEMDVAIVTLNEKLPLGSGLSIIELDLLREFKENDVVTVIGYGETTNWNDPVRLRKTDLTVVNPLRCPDTKICAIGGHGNQVCSGDSGGPAIYQGKQVGVTSAADYINPCLGFGLTYFTRLGASENAKWITETMREHC